MQVDLSSIVSGHMDYADKIDEILISLGYAEEEEPLHALRKSSSCSNLRSKDKTLTRSHSVDSLVIVRKAEAIKNMRVGGK